MTPKQLKKIRQSLNLSITEMAAWLNTPRGTYIKWERGERRVPGMIDVTIKCLKGEK
jgi:DNA-binding transcriptional regulator YiaG